MSKCHDMYCENDEPHEHGKCRGFCGYCEVNGLECHNPD